MRSVGYKPAMIILVICAGVAIGVVHWWLGPQVTVYAIEPMPLVQTVVAAGRVITESRTQVGSEIAGVVLERLVQEGDQVRAGDTLLVLRADDIAAQVRQAEAALSQLLTSTRPQADVTLKRAESQREQASRETERRQALTQRSLLSVEALEQAEQAELMARSAVDSARLTVTALAAGGVEEVLLRERLTALQAQLAKSVLKAEADGIILTRNVEPGDLVQPGRVLFTMALSGHTDIRVPFDERNLSLLSVQQTAVAIADAYPDQPFPARIGFIAPGIDPQRGTVEVRLVVDPVPPFLRQDMTVSVNVETGRRERTLAVPDDALGEVNGDQAQVWLVRDNKVYRQPVTLGLRGLAMSEVIDGLSAGDRVLADGSAALTDGTRVRVTVRPSPLGNNSADADSRNELPVKFD